MRKMTSPVKRRRRGRVTRKCQECTATFDTVQSQINNGNGKFCSRKCWETALAKAGEKYSLEQDGRACCRCGIYKLAEEFGINPQTPTRLRANCGKCRREMEKERRHRNPMLAKEQRLATLLRQYGMTSRDYEEMLKSQDGVCSICSRIPGNGLSRFVVDHDHATGRVRGLLCSNCNIGLANFRDSQTHLDSAIKYLDRHEAS